VQYQYKISNQSPTKTVKNLANCATQLPRGYLFMSYFYWWICRRDRWLANFTANQLTVKKVTKNKYLGSNCYFCIKQLYIFKILTLGSIK